MKRLRGAELLEYLTKPPPTLWSDHVKVPVYRQEDYLRLLKKDYEEKGLEYDEAKFRVPVDPPEIQKFEEPESCTHPFGELFLNLTYTKTKVKVKINYALYNLHEKYYAVGKAPPVKTLVQALKTVGHSNEFLKKVIRGYDENALYAKKIWKYLEKKLFKEEKKKKKKKKKQPVVDEFGDVVEDEDEDQETESTITTGDDDVFDMEMDDDEDFIQDDVDAYSDLDDD